MMPDNVLSRPNQPGRFLSPDDREVGQYMTVAYEQGGIAISDPTQGLQVQNWVFWITNYIPLVGGDGIAVRPETGGAEELIYSGVKITEVSGSFDANMKPVIAFVENNVAKLRWYDATVPGYTLTELPNCYSPRLTLDDKRDSANNSRDILLFYLDNVGALKERIQRERYGVEYEIMSPDLRRVAVGRVGMADNFRLQIEILMICDVEPDKAWGDEAPPIKRWGGCPAVVTTDWDGCDAKPAPRVVL